MFVKLNQTSARRQGGDTVRVTKTEDVQGEICSVRNIPF